MPLTQHPYIRRNPCITAMRNRVPRSTHTIHKSLPTRSPVRSAPYDPRSPVSWKVPTECAAIQNKSPDSLLCFPHTNPVRSPDTAWSDQRSWSESKCQKGKTSKNSSAGWQRPNRHPKCMRYNLMYNKKSPAVLLSAKGTMYFPFPADEAGYCCSNGSEGVWH